MNGQFVKIRLTSQVIYRQDSLKIECLEDGLTNKDSIYGFVLTKKIGDVTSDVVKVDADPTNPPYYQKVCINNGMHNYMSTHCTLLLYNVSYLLYDVEI